jgi:hypothetical protein
MRALRGALTAEAVQAATGISPSKLSRIESASVRLHEQDALQLATLYKLGSQQTAQLLARVREARDPSILKEFAGHDWTQALRGHLELEADATRIDSFTIDLVPGLLQIREYCRALITDRPDIDNETINRRLAFRAARQRRVQSGELELWAIIDESALYREVGGPATLVEQLVALLDAPSNVTVQILPWSAGSHASIGTAFHLFQFQRWPAVVYQEALREGLYYIAEDVVEEHARILNATRAAALSPRDSRARIGERLTRLRE